MLLPVKLQLDSRYNVSWITITAVQTAAERKCKFSVAANRFWHEREQLQSPVKLYCYSSKRLRVYGFFRSAPVVS